MKMLFFLLIFTPSVILASPTYAQSTKLSLNHTNRPLLEVLDEIENVTEFHFYYNSKLVDTKQKVTVNADSEDVVKVLDGMLHPTEIAYRVIGKDIILSRKDGQTEQSIKQATQRTVSGTIVDERGEPLIGVSVVEKGTTNGVVTDVDGKYKLNLTKDKATVVFGYIGYASQSILVNDKQTIDVAMKPNENQLDEVMVVGYGVQKKGSVTAAISQIDAEKMSKVPVANLSERMAGVVPGVIALGQSGQPGADDSKLEIRGVGAKYIVDGIERSFDQIDPNEVATVSVLKDASAAAVYGLNASSVIIITTNRGKDEKSKITFSANYGVSQNTNMLKMLDAPQYAYWYNKARVLDGDSEVFTDAQVRKMIAGQDGWGNTNWYKKAFGSGNNTQLNMTVTGGNEKMKYFTSVGSFDQEGNVDGFKFNRLNIRSNVDAVIADNLTFSVDIAGRIEKRKSPGYSGDPQVWNNISQQALRALPYVPDRWQGLPVAPRTASTYVNPIAAANESGYNNSRINTINTTFSLKYDMAFLQGLSAKAVVAYDYYDKMTKALATPYKVNLPQLPGTVGNDLQYVVDYDPRGNKEYLGESATHYNKLTSYLSLNYDRIFGDHSVNAIVVGEIFRSNENKLEASGNGLNFHTQDELAHITDRDKLGIGGMSWARRRAGFVGRVSYAYQGKYMAEVSARYDGHDTFSGMKSSNRWGLFPAVSMGWRISQEDFMKSTSSVLDDLKLRLGIGKTGYTSIPPYFYLNTLEQKTPDGKIPWIVINGIAQPAYLTNALANVDLTWEKHLQYNVGVDASLWNGLLGIELDVFYKYISDILGRVGRDVPPSMGGFHHGYANRDKQDHKGFEIALTHKNKIGDFKYNVTLNGTSVKRRWLKCSDDSPNTPDWMKKTGKDVGARRGFIALGLFKSEEEIANSALIEGKAVRVGDIKYLDRNGDGVITVEQDGGFVAKSDYPKFTGGLNFNGEWKGFDISFMFLAGLGRDVAITGEYPDSGIMDHTSMSKPFYHGGNSPRYLLERSWTPENTNGEFPRLAVESASSNNAFSSSFWYRNGNYLRLKNLEVGYTLPSTLTSKAKISNLRFFVNGQNLLTFSGLNKYNIDPEAPGVNSGYYPQQRVIAGGVKLTF